MTNHDRFRRAFAHRRNEVLTTAQIRHILRRAYPDMSEGSALPNDHAEGNKSDCGCAGTSSRIFDRLRRGLYRVR
jgi:hypothetical protein